MSRSQTFSWDGDISRRCLLAISIGTLYLLTIQLTIQQGINNRYKVPIGDIYWLHPTLYLYRYIYIYPTRYLVISNQSFGYRSVGCNGEPCRIEIAWCICCAGSAPLAKFPSKGRRERQRTLGPGAWQFGDIHTVEPLWIFYCL